MTQTLKEALAASLQANRSLSFYGYSGFESSLSFSEFAQLVDSRAQALQGLGVGPGVVVAVMGPTSLELATTCAAVWMCEATLTVLPTPTRLGNLEQFLAETLAKIDRSKASVLVGEEGAVACFAEMAGIPVLPWGDLDSTSDLRLEPALQSCQPALIQFSSGTTRDPHPILLSQEALLHNAQAVLECFPGGASNHSCVSWLPLYHDMGLIGCFLMPLLAPGDLTLMGPEVFAVRPVTWLEAISERKATTSSAPNFALAYCADRLTDKEIGDLDLSSWKISMVGAEAVRPKTLRRFAERFAGVGFDPSAFSPVYGLAEATLAVTFSPLGEGLRTLEFDREELAASGRVQAGSSESPCLGKPLRGVEVEIRRDGKVVEEDQLGDVFVRSASLLTGTLEQGELVKPQADWLDTGDAGFLHKGDLYLYGRRRDILLLDGRNHDPSVVEAAAEGLDELRRCCAFCAEVEEEEKDKLLLLCEVSRKWEGDPLALQEKVRTHCRREANLVPHEVVLLRSGELPVTSSGKLQRSKAAQMHKDSKLLGLETSPV